MGRIIFQLERLILRGPPFQLLLIAVLIALVSLFSGIILSVFHSDFGDFGEAVWWGFLRLSDPGYLGDDEGALARTVSTVVTVLGYVLFMGALIAIMSQGLYRTMARLEAGLTPLRRDGHVLVLGWNNRTTAIVRELLLSEGRVRRFLGRIGARRLYIVILAQHVDSTLAADLRDELGALWDGSKVVFRSGNPLRIEHLERADFLNAAAIILPASEFGQDGAAELDARVTKILMSVSNAALAAEGRPSPPLFVTEMFDPRKAVLAGATYSGAVEIVPSSAIISRLIAQNVRHSGLSYVYDELLTHGTGNEIYVRAYDMAGARFDTLNPRFPDAIPLGVLRGAGDGGAIRPMLNPPGDLVVEPGDRIVFMARGYDSTTPVAAVEAAAAVERLGDPPEEERQSVRRVLMLGWSSKLPILLSEFGSYTRERFQIDLVSVVSAQERERHLAQFGPVSPNVELRQVEADYTGPVGLASLAVASYDNAVFLASDWMTSEEESDARTILGYLMLHAGLDQVAGGPRVLVELMEPENEALFRRQSGEVLISPTIVSHMLAHVALRPELRLIFEELFTTEGAEIYFRPPEAYLASGGETVGFRDIQRLVAARGDVALGVLRARGADEVGFRLHLNPPRDSMWTFSPGDELVVLTTYS